MTERIDLDELDAGETDEDDPNPGDWFWRGEGDPEDAPEAVTEVETSGSESPAGSSPSDSGGEVSSETSSDPIPRVPRENEDKPVGVPADSGGAGVGVESGGADSTPADEAGASERDARDANAHDAHASASVETNNSSRSPSGPHGGGADDMTLAFTYAAATRLSNFGAVAADAYGWADWVGLVGRVPAHVLNKFQRDRNVDLDFFNGASADPGERLARIGPRSMFYSERMVVVGVPGEDEDVAETADWEFVPLPEAAEKAGWEVGEDETEGSSE
ncbi:DUF7124 domain-containing protein [Halorussus salinisoli]|uniref:DUF7124 domain-containing protein n=1 Tax=Halorussus salinisoli TaxID=2558242 RepID=UPI0010C21D70|nr:hypothetical protein [Halorussus salinisoli]